MRIVNFYALLPAPLCFLTQELNNVKMTSDLPVKFVYSQIKQTVRYEKDTLIIIYSILLYYSFSTGSQLDQC